MFIAHRRVAQTAVRHFRSLNLIASATWNATTLPLLFSKEESFRIRESVCWTSANLPDVVTSHRTVCVTEDLWARLTSFWRGRNAYDQNKLTKNLERSRDSSIITLREQHSRLSCILGLVPVTAEGWLSTLSMEISAWYHFEIRLYFGVYSFLYKIIRLEQQIFSRLQNWQHSTLLSINVFIFRLLSTRVNPLIGADTVPLRPAAPVFDIRRQSNKKN